MDDLRKFINFLKQHKGFLGIVITLVLWSLLIYFFKPTQIVSKIGINNGYFIAFSLAVLGGVSSFTSTSLYATVITLVIGGANPYLLGLLTGIGVTFGDSFFFYLGLKGRKIISQSFENVINKLTVWLKEKPCWGVSLIIFLYASFAPLPNDLLMVALAVLDTPYKKVVLFPLLIGNINFMILLGVLAKHGITLFS